MGLIIRTSQQTTERTHELAIPSTPRPTLDAQANQTIRASSTRTNRGCTAMTNQIKPCPFCGSESKLIVEDWVNPNGYEYGSGRTSYVRCLGCKAQGGFSSINNFNMFSKYTVKDFRESNLLRAIEDERYEAYVEEQKSKAVSLWNGRAQLPEAPL